MDELAKSFATNYYLQSAAILASLAIVPYWLWKLLKSINGFLKSVVGVGLKKAIIRIRINIKRKAIFDSKDIILFQTRVITILFNISLSLIFYFIFEGFGSRSEMVQSDIELVGSAMPEYVYQFGGLAIFIFKYIYLMLALFGLVHLDAYVKIVRKYRIKKQREAMFR